MPKVRAPFLSSTGPPQPSIPIMGITVGLDLLMVAVVSGAVNWKKCSRKEESEFSCLTGGFKPR